MQYFKPPAPPLWAGDCMPFFHDGVFHVYYLQDENHHGALGGLGGHQWAHSSSPDLIHWTHHPLAIGITHDWEGSICTGTPFFHDGVYYGFYATRLRDWTQHLDYATSPDAVTFQKVEPHPLASPLKGYDPLHYRDPFVFWDEGSRQYHMLVTALLNDYPVDHHGGCLAHLVSDDLRQWKVEAPFYIPGLTSVPECPDYFFWNGWYYLLFGDDGITRYRMSREPFGPWRRPACDVVDSPAMRVMKTAAFTGGRRIGVAWVGTREHDKDKGRWQWGGHIVLHEIIQHADGTLGTQFVPELIPPVSQSVVVPVEPLTDQVRVEDSDMVLNAAHGLQVAMVKGLPQEVRITVQVKPGSSAGTFGLRLRGSGRFANGYDLTFSAPERRVTLFDESIGQVEGLMAPFELDVMIKGDLIDVCVDQRRGIINRCPELHGDALFFFARDAQVTFENLKISALA